MATIRNRGIPRTFALVSTLAVAMGVVGAAPPAAGSAEADPVEAVDTPPDAPPAELLRMHEDFVSAFVESDGFGYARVTPMMRVMHRYRTQGQPSLWVANVALVGIAKHDPPVVFASPFQGFLHAPDMPSGSEIAVRPRPEGRPLTQAEREAVRALENGVPLLVHADGDGLRATGPIRARSECLACHKGKREGDLLGAFVYTLRPLPPDAR
jgi:hypothetical protein